MTLALSYRQFVDSSAQRHAAHFRPFDLGDDCIDELLDDGLANDTADVCRKIALNGMIGLDTVSFDDD